MIFHSLMTVFIIRGTLFQKRCIMSCGRHYKPICPFSNSSFSYVNKDTVELAETLFDLFDDEIISYISNIDYFHTLQNHL